MPTAARHQPRALRPRRPCGAATSSPLQRRDPAATFAHAVAPQLRGAEPWSPLSHSKKSHRSWARPLSEPSAARLLRRRRQRLAHREGGPALRRPRTEDRDGHDFVADAVSNAASPASIVASSDVDVAGHVGVFRSRDTTHALGELAPSHRQRFLTCATIAITGNVGKTTTKELTAALLGTHYDVLKSPGQLQRRGRPLDDPLRANAAATSAPSSRRHGPPRRDRAPVRDCEARDCAVVMNVGPTHLERLGTMEAIAQAKGEAVEAPACRRHRHPQRRRPVRRRHGLEDAGARPDLRHEPRRLRPRLRHRAATASTASTFSSAAAGAPLPPTRPLPGRDLVYNALAAIARRRLRRHDGRRRRRALRTRRRAELACRPSARPSTAPPPRRLLQRQPRFDCSPPCRCSPRLPGRRLALLGDMLELGAAEDAAGHAQVGEYAAAGGRRPVHRRGPSRRADRRLRPRRRHRFVSPLRRPREACAGATRPSSAPATSSWSRPRTACTSRT